MVQPIMSAVEMAAAIRHKQISSEELVADAIARAQKVNPSLNAIVSDRYEAALQEARAFSRDDLPFGGVPIFVKDLGQEQAGELSTSGSRLFANYRASQDDHLIQRIKELGFIILGRTNTPEFGFKNTSDASLHGPVHLPDDLSRNAGGSSGGSSALVAAGVVPLALASDGGGSIRIPASFNGLVGLKPTRGRIPVGPHGYRGWQGASVHFAVSQTVADSQALFQQLQTEQWESPFLVPRLSLESLQKGMTRPHTIAVMVDSPIKGIVSTEAVEATVQTASFLRHLGHRVIEISSLPVDGHEAMESYYIMNSVETAAMFQAIEKQLGRAVTPEDMELMTWAIYQAGKGIPATEYSRILNLWDRYSAQMQEFHETYDLLLTPTVADVAPKEGQFQLSERLQQNLRSMEEFPMTKQQELIWEMFQHSLDWTPFTQQANLTGQPAMSVPVYRRKDGLAIGVQFTAAKGREDLLFQVARLLETEGQFH